MNIKDIAQRIHSFQQERYAAYGGKLTSELVFIHLMEEIGEVARQLFSKGSNMREFNQDNLKEEITQVLLDVLVLAELHDVDYEEAIEAKMKDMKKRFQPR